jgi:hypothetical protein
VRRKRVRRDASIFQTHPAPESRMVDLRASRREVKGGTGEAARGRARYLQAIGPIRTTLLDDQVKLNDPGASLYIIENLAKDGWTGQLRFSEAKSGVCAARRATIFAAAGRLRGRCAAARRPARSLAQCTLRAAKAGRRGRREAALAGLPRARPRWRKERADGALLTRANEDRMKSFAPPCALHRSAPARGGGGLLLLVIRPRPARSRRR